MRMKFSAVAAALLTISGLHVASAATKHNDKAQSATVELVNLNNPKDVLLKADIDLTKNLPQQFKNQATMGYIAQAGTDGRTPGEVTVGYAIKSEIKAVHSGDELNMTVDAAYLGDNGFIPVNRMTHQFNTFQSGNLAIELPNLTSVSVPETVDIPREADYKETILVPNVGGTKSPLALRVTPHYAK